MFTERVRVHGETDPTYPARWDALRRLLLDAAASWDVVPPLVADDVLDALVARGRSFSAEHCIIRPGRQSACHHNVVELLAGDRTLGAATGYALSADGLWRQHSWGVCSSGTVIETTAERIAYFGVDAVLAGSHRAAPQ